MSGSMGVACVAETNNIPPVTGKFPSATQAPWEVYWSNG